MWRCMAAFAALAIHRAVAQQTACTTDAGNDAAADADALWSAEDVSAAAHAASAAARFIERYASQADHRVLNTASFFAELADTSTDQATVNTSRRLATEYILSLEERSARQFSHGTFGMLFGTQHDIVDLMQLLNYQKAIGLQIPEGLVANASATYKTCDDCNELTAGDDKDPNDLVDVMLRAYVLDESRFRFGANVFPVPEGLLGRAMSRARSAYNEETASSGLLQVGESLGEEGLAPSPFVMKCLLATHIVFVVNGFDRYAASGSQVPEVISFLRRAWPEIWKLNDVELMGEVVAAFRAVGCGPETDAMARAGARRLLKQQRKDGAWGTDERFNKTRFELGVQGEAYDVLHHVWTPTSALRPRRVLDDAYAAHLRQELAALEAQPQAPRAPRPAPTRQEPSRADDAHSLHIRQEFAAQEVDAEPQHARRIKAHRHMRGGW